MVVVCGLPPPSPDPIRPSATFPSEGKARSKALSQGKRQQSVRIRYYGFSPQRGRLRRSKALSQGKRQGKRQKSMRIWYETGGQTINVSSYGLAGRNNAAMNETSGQTSSGKTA